MILKKQIVEKISKDLRLPYTGIEQDWELEMADPERVEEFLNYYKESDLSTNHKITLMSLILASYDDFLNENGLEIDSKWKEIKDVLVSEMDIYSELISYWAFDHETTTEDSFKITPLVRKIKRAE